MHKTMVSNLVLFLVKIWYRPKRERDSPQERERERDVNVSDSLGYSICIGYV